MDISRRAYPPTATTASFSPKAAPAA